MAELFTNARILAGGYDFSGQFNQVSLEYSAEALDATSFGNASQVKKGGLRTASLKGAGFWSSEIDPVYFDEIGLVDVAVTVFPMDIAEGSTSSGFGYGFEVLVSKYTPLGGKVGDLLPFTIELEGRGLLS